MNLVIHDGINFTGNTYSLNFKNVGHTNLDEHPLLKEFLTTAKSISFVKKPSANC
jgi:hypothetical protein